MSILVLDIGGTAVKFGLCDEQGVLIRTGECPTQAELGGRHIVQMVQRIVEEYPEATAVGIATAGTVDTRDGHIVYATDNIPGYTGIPLGEMVSQRCGKPVCVENDVYAAALGELAYGSGQKLHSFLFLTVGTGIGGAFVSEGRLQRGFRGVAGYFGHMVTHPGGRLCTCGQHGCYEAYASTAALLKRVREVTGEMITGRELFARMENDQVLHECFEQWIRELSSGVVTLINAYDPQAVILGGGVMAQPIVIETLRNRVVEQLPPVTRQVTIQVSGLGNTAGMMGAAYAVRQRIGAMKEG